MDMIKKITKFSNIEKLFMIVIAAILTVTGIVIVSVSTKNKNINNFKKDTINIINIAKNSYASFNKQGKNEYIATGTDSKTKGMCITIKGLEKNGYLTKDYSDWDGYIVIEETENKEYYYTIWASNKKYSIEGYEQEKLKDLTLKNGLSKSTKEKFTNSVKTSFSGTSGSKGGTGSTDGSNIIKYNATCINEKVE